MRRIAFALLTALALLSPATAWGQACPAVAALPDTERRTTYSPSSSTGPFSVGFAILGDSTDAGNWLEVWLNGTKLTYTTQWTFGLSGGGSVATACRPITTGQVTLVTAATGTLEIVGARRPRRTSQFAENRGVSARDLNQVITDLTAMEREQWDLRSRSLLTKPGDTIGNLPAAATRAGGVLCFDGSGNPLACTALTGLGNVIGPNVSVVGHIPIFANTSGTLLADGGVVGAGDVVGPSSSTVGHVATFNATTGKLIKDSGLTLTDSTGTFTLTNAKTFAVTNTLTLGGTDGSTVAFGAGGTVVYTSNNLSALASTTSAQLRSVLSDETGTGAAVFADTPTLITPNFTTSFSVSTVTFGALSTNYHIVYSPNGRDALTLGNASDPTNYSKATTHQFSSADGVTPFLGITSGGLTYYGSSSGNTLLKATAVASGTLTLPTATDTLVGKATTDTLTNKTFDTAGTGNSFSINGVAVTANTGTGSVVRATSPTLVTPTLGVATATSINKMAITAPATSSTLAVADGKTLTASNTLTFTGTDGTSFAFPGTSDTVVSLTATQTLTNKTLTSPTINGGAATALTGLAIRSTGTGAFDLTFANTENLTAGRTLTLTLNNANRTLNLSGNMTLSAAFTTAGSSALTLTTTSTTNVTLPTSGTLATIDTAQTFSGSNIFSALTQFTNIKLSSGFIYPTSDSTTALQLGKADGTTAVLKVDTTNARIGINKTPGAFDLDVNGATNVGGTLTFGTLSSTSLAASTSTITGLTVNNSPVGANDYFLYYDAANARISRCTIAACSSAATAGVSSLNGLTGGLSIAAATGNNTGISVSAASTTVTIGNSTPEINIKNCSLAASVGSNLLTVSLKDAAGSDPSSTSPCLIPFRSSTASTGTFSINVQTASLSISTNATGATLGSSNSTAFRFWVVAFDNGGTNVLALFNASTSSECFPIDETQVQSSTAISGSATSAGTYYTPNGTTLSSKAIRILGYVEYNSSGLGTAGTYASGPNFIQNFTQGMHRPCESIRLKQTAQSQDKTTTSTTFVASTNTITITPTSAANLIRVRGLPVILNDNATGVALVKWSRGTSDNTNMIGSRGQFGNCASCGNMQAIEALDKPNTASSQTYAMQLAIVTAGTATLFGATVPNFMYIEEIMG